MRQPTPHDYLVLLQSLARATVRQHEQQFTPYWGRIVLAAGCPEKENYEDLTWAELQQVHVYLVDEQQKLLEKWGQLIDEQGRVPA